jgi:hypothetical protein
MRKRCLLLAALVLIGSAGPATFADEPVPAGASVTPLHNRDVLNLVARGAAPEAVVELIKASPCNFDTFPPVMQDLARRGVPAEVLRAMFEAPYGPPAEARQDGAAGQPIYHYAEQLKQFSLPSSSQGRRGAANSQRLTRAQATRAPSRRRL